MPEPRFQIDEMTAEELKDWLRWRANINCDELRLVLMVSLDRSEGLQRLVEIQGGRIARLEATLATLRPPIEG